MSIEQRPQSVVLRAGGALPCKPLEAQMREGLKAAWTINDRTIYAHPERFEDGELYRMFKDGEAEAVVLRNSCENVLGWAALISKPVGNKEIGSVNARQGYGTPLMEQLFLQTEKEALINPFLLVDEGGLRSAMGSAAEKAADNTGLRIPVPIYVSPNVYGEVDKKDGTVWGCYGTSQISTSYLDSNGPLVLPKLPKQFQVSDGSEDIIDDVILIGNAEGVARGRKVFAERELRGDVDIRSVHEVTKGLLEVDYFDDKTRLELTKDGYKPFGIDLGMIDGRIAVGVHYSAAKLPETWFGKQTCFSEGAHPLRSVSSTKTAFAELVRVRQQAV